MKTLPSTTGMTVQSVSAVGGLAMSSPAASVATFSEASPLSTTPILSNSPLGGSKKKPWKKKKREEQVKNRRNISESRKF
jgi:hypothetical protein